MYARITRYSKLNLAFPITVHFIFLMLPQIHKNTKYLPWKKWFLVDILSLLLVRPKTFINITSDVFHCHAPGKNLLECRTIPCNDDCDVLTCSIHGIQQRHLILCSMIIYFPPPFSKNIVIVLWAIYIYMLPNLIGWMVDSNCIAIRGHLQCHNVNVRFLWNIRACTPIVL